MSRITRRRLLESSLLAGGGLLFSRSIAKAARGVLGANERVRVAVAGLNGRGVSHIGAYLGMEKVEIAYLVDPDSRLFASRMKKVADKSGREPAVVQDIRRVLEDKTVDAVSLATPNHWHSLMTIWACQAGKDVYVEKPLSHNIREGRVAVQAARRYGRIVQHGTQSRSRGGWDEVVAVIRSRKLGRLLVSRGLCYKSRPSIGFKSPTQPPSELNFDLWLGPVREQPYHENLVHYNWHWFWDTGNGDIGNQGVHEMDKARWAIPEATLPKSVISLGGRFGYEDPGETPNTQIAIFDYGQTQLIFEVRGLPTDKYLGQACGNVYHLEGGTIRGPTFYPEGSNEPAPLPDVGYDKGPKPSIFENFIAAVRSRKSSDLTAEVLEGHYSSALCHLANASYRLGELVPFNPRTRAFGDNTEVFETLGRMEEHLAKNGLKLDATKYRLGRKLVVDPSSERVVGDDQANQILE
ncbi:MAG: Gfo/Idh/MocA family oxidoreductase, partial [Firmicutes bacterium]|nr:Gfo/Idh/MocA family oxidoreductase [Bacillota bacterium]